LGVNLDKCQTVRQRKSLKTQEWHNRFVQQSSWTTEARSFILNRIRLPQQARILEIGSGTGAILDSYPEPRSGQLFGLDLHFQFLRFNKIGKPTIELINADGYCIPFLENYFDFVYCHYLLLWIQEPVKMLQEMKRVVRKESWVACFAEPDYQGRIDYPENYSKLGLLQNQSMKIQGARIDGGRQIAHQLQDAGFSNITWGIIGANRPLVSNLQEAELEQKVLENDLNLLAEEKSNPFRPFENLADDNLESHIQFIPTFFAYAQKSG